MTEPLVSIRLMVFNNEPYIREAIEGILLQKTNFKIEVVVGDDFSTDKTLEILKSYNHTENIYFNVLNREVGGQYWTDRQRLGRLHNFRNIVDSCSGKYLALLDGDDYWTDPLKLQKQVEFLETNTHINICFHRAQVLRGQELSMHKIPEFFNKEPFNYLELLKHYNFITTASVLLRKPKAFNFPSWFYNLPFGDIGLYKLISKGKKIQCLDEVMCVYRIHEKGIYSGLSNLNVQQNYLDFYNIICPLLNVEEKKIVFQKIKEVNYKISKLKFPNNPLFQKLYNIYLRFKSLNKWIQL